MQKLVGRVLQVEGRGEGSIYIVTIGVVDRELSTVDEHEFPIGKVDDERMIDRGLRPIDIGDKLELTVPDMRNDSYYGGLSVLTVKRDGIMIIDRQGGGSQQ